jgi:hypothetical protein
MFTLTMEIILEIKRESLVLCTLINVVKESNARRKRNTQLDDKIKTVKIWLHLLCENVIYRLLKWTIVCIFWKQWKYQIIVFTISKNATSISSSLYHKCSYQESHMFPLGKSKRTYILENENIKWKHKVNGL